MKMTVADLIESAISWEIEAQDLYRECAKSFADHPSICEFWRLMAVDESSHVALLRDVRDAMPSDRLARPLTEEELGSIRSIREELAQSRKAEVRTLDDVYELAHRFEASEINSVFHMLVLDGLDASKTSALIEAQFTEHIDRLEGFGQEFDRSARQAIRPRSVSSHDTHDR